MSHRLQLALQMQRRVEQAGGTVSTFIELFAKSEHGVAMRAAKDVPPFQCLLTVPQRLCLMADQAMKSDSTMALAQVTAALLDSKRCSLTGSSPPAYIRSDVQSMVHSEAVLSTYLDLLPTSADMATSFPSHWSSEHWRGLHNTTLYHQHKIRRAQVLQMYEKTAQSRRQPQDDATFCLEAWSWAQDVIGSRSFGVGGACALVPLMDLLDHSVSISQHTLGSTPGCMVLRDLDQQAYHLFSLAPIPRGHEIYISYGDLSQSSALLGYGFALDTCSTSATPAKVVAGETSGAEVAVQRHETVRGGFCFQLALPVVPDMSRRGRLSYGYQVFDFDRSCLDEGVEDLLAAGVGRKLIERAVKRRLKVVGSLMNDHFEQPLAVVEDQREHHRVKGLILRSELGDLECLDSFLMEYDRFLDSKPRILEERTRRQVAECKDIMGYAHLFREQTGLDIAPELFGDEDMSTLLL